MRFTPRLPVALLLSVLVLSACAAPVALIQLDNEWARTYTAKLEAERANPDFLLSLTSSASFDAQLTDLSQRAEKQGDAVGSKDPATALGFYRIAAAAAWKSGTARETQVLPISDKGVRACDALPNRDASQPRDCSFMRVVPQLASLDVKAREIGALRDAGAQIPEAQLPRAIAVTAEVTTLMENVLETRAASASMPPSFGDYLKLNLNGEFCTLQGLFGRVSASNPSPEQKNRMRDLLAGTQAKLQGAGIPTTCT